MASLGGMTAGGYMWQKCVLRASQKQKKSQLPSARRVLWRNIVQGISWVRYLLQCTFRRGQEKNHTAWIVNTGNELIVRANTDFQPCREPEMTQSFGTSTGWVDDLNTSQAEIC